MGYCVQCTVSSDGRGVVVKYEGGLLYKDMENAEAKI